jgi:uncharacterized protein (TIGR02145 family)
MNKILFLLSLLCIVGCSNNKRELTDAEGNTYPIRKYGETTWMMENLRVKNDQLGNSVKYYLPNGDENNAQAFGLLYTYEVACMVCPAGWRLPTNEDWDNLFNLPETNIAANYKDGDFWNESNTNSSAFSIRPAGVGNNVDFNTHFNSKAILWSKTKEDEHFVWTYILEEENDSIRIVSQHPTYAFSIRCVKEN